MSWYSILLTSLPSFSEATLGSSNLFSQTVHSLKSTDLPDYTQYRSPLIFGVWISGLSDFPLPRSDPYPYPKRKKVSHYTHFSSSHPYSYCAFAAYENFNNTQPGYALSIIITISIIITSSWNYNCLDAIDVKFEDMTCFVHLLDQSN